MKFLKYINNTIALSVILAFSFSVFMSSCEDEDPDAGKIELHSFGPSGVQHGDIIQFIGLNLDQVTSIILPGEVEVSSSEFSSKSAKVIEIVVPDGAESGKVVLKTPQGDIETLTNISFEVPVVISSITEEVKPGENVTIKGEFLNWIESITFNDGLLVEKFVSQTLTELVVTLPMEAQTGYITFASGGTEPLTIRSENELIVTLPVVTALSPEPVKHTENLTLSGTDLDLITSIVFAGDFTESFFVSQTETQLVVTVPVGVVDGPLTLNVHSPIQVMTDQSVTILLPVGTDLSPSPAVPGTDNITINGSDLDLISEILLPGVDDPITSFVSQSATQIVVAVPEGAANGSVAYTTIHGYSNNLGVTLIVPGEGPPPLAINLYDESIEYGGGDWSWNTVVSDPANTEQFYSGDVSWKFETSSDGGVSVGGMSGVDASSLGVFVFSVYGGPGTDGAQLAVILNDNWGNYNSVTLVEGAWTEYRLDYALYPDIDFSNITRWIFKVEGVAGTTIYVDRIGFDPAGPPPLDYYIYDDAVQNSWAEWGGWGHDELDFASTEEVLVGDNAIKVTFNDTYGAVQIGSPSADVFSGYTTLSFQVHAPAAQDLIVQIGNYADTYLSIPAGWSLVEIPIADMDGNTDVGELRIKNNNANLPVTLFLDEIGLNN